MVHSRILKYIFSALMLLSAISSIGQSDDRYRLALGVDASRFVVPFIDKGRLGWELSADTELLKDMFVSLEFGSQTCNLTMPKYEYTSSGAYTRLGVDYNYMKHIDSESTDKLFVGLRYGFTSFYHQADNIQIESPVWGNIENISVGRNWLNANWMEVATGMRAHLFNNFYLGWSARFRIKLWLQNDPVMQPYYIPGFGRGWSSTWVGFNYSLYYQIPLFKKKSKV